MKQIKLLGTTLFAVFALASITASLAQAAATLPNLLPEATGANPITATSKSGTSIFGNGILSVTSPKSEGSLTQNSLKLGFFKTTFEGSENALTGTKCNGLGLGAGLINVEGTFHIRHYNEGTLKTAAIFLLSPVHFECGAAALIVVLGCVAGGLTPQNVLTKTLTVTLAKTGSDNFPITILKEELNGEEACQLLASESDSATFKLSAETSVQLLEKAKQGGVEITVLVMPL